jgi:hypothetical protein
MEHLSQEFPGLSEGQVAPLGNNGNNSATFDRNARLRLREVLWRVTEIEDFQKCGRVPNSSFFPVRQYGDQFRLGGFCTCKSVWSCPICAPSIRAARGVELALVFTQHLVSGRATFGTATVRHGISNSLDESLSVVMKAWNAMNQHRVIKEFRADHGYIGFCRTAEITFGVNGFHPHLHWVDFWKSDVEETLERNFEQGRQGGVHGDRLVDVEPPSASPIQCADGAQEVLGKSPARSESIGLGKAQAEYEGLLFEVWRNAVVRLGMKEPSRERGIKVLSVFDGDVSDYLFKLTPKSAGHELTNLSTKVARGVGSLAPFDLLALAGSSSDLRFLDAWHEYERSTRNRRMLGWTKGLRRRLGVNLEDPEPLDFEKSFALDVATVAVIDEFTMLFLRASAGGMAGVHQAIEAGAALGGRVGVEQAVAMLLDVRAGVPWSPAVVDEVVEFVPFQPSQLVLWGS